MVSNSSVIRAMFEEGKRLSEIYGEENVFDYSIGNPNIEAPSEIKDIIIKILNEENTNKLHGYMNNSGYEDVRDGIAENINVKYNTKLNYENIVMTCGAAGGLNIILKSILNPGDEVIIPAPYYVNYEQMVQMCHAKPIIVDNPDGEKLGFKVEDVENAITEKTKVIIINTPSNPSGKIIPVEKIEALATLAKQYDLVIISDEVYKCLIYADSKFKNIVEIEGMRERTILVNSLSKEFCMTGWRIGYVLAPAEVIAAMTKFQENVAACAPLPSQYAAIEALSGENDYSANMVNIFTKRRNILVDGINRIPKLSCEAPEATFYLMVDISETGMKSEEFAIALLKAVHVAVVPGITYGRSCDNYVRMAFTLGEDKIQEGIKRIQTFINQLPL